MSSLSAPTCRGLTTAATSVRAPGFHAEASAARPDARARLEEVLDRLAADGVSLVRLFLLCDLRSGIRFDSDGSPLGPDDAFFRDADTVFAAAAVRGLRLLPVLFDFHLCGAPQVVGGVQLGGRGALLADPVKWERLLSNVVRPVAERYGQRSEIAAWDLFNEPDWCARSFARRPGIPEWCPSIGCGRASAKWRSACTRPRANR